MGYIGGFPKSITEKIVGKDPKSTPLPNGNFGNNMSPGLQNQYAQPMQPPQMMMPGMGGPFGGQAGGMQGPPTLPGLDM